jgi:hypothetical protein
LQNSPSYRPKTVIRRSSWLPILDARSSIVPAMLVTDGPHWVRRVPDVTAVGAPSLPATCFPTASNQSSL